MPITIAAGDAPRYRRLRRLETWVLCAAAAAGLTALVVWSLTLFTITALAVIITVLTCELKIIRILTTTTAPERDGHE